MRLTIAPFDRARHMRPASILLAERHARDRARDPRLPAAFEVPDACRPLIEQALDQLRAYGVVVKDAGDIVGFAVMSAQVFPQTHFLASFFPLRGTTIGHASHASAPGREYDVYREMYGALAEHFVALGYFDHGINVSASDVAVIEAMFTLGFGRSMAAAVRGVGPTAKTAASVEVHEASAEDAEVIFKLNEELTLHHARSPIFNPFIRESDEASHEMQRSLLADPAENAHWVAYDDGKAVGMNTFMQPGFLAPMTLPDKTIYLFQGIVTQDARAGGVGTAILQRGVDWAREKGYDHIALHFASSNISGSRFWQSSGFIPIEFGLRRRIDDRIAWANR
jgi:GNAT superfamily N-acetyltransferase